ncbi:MAG TPA: efflux RND transporter periplasmic adaptor subunit [Bryobacteraceae bacterium]|nr:efflux RND transporter periplasmic adaptor subunit [Bryobacteraceae bacterium]
MLDSERMIETPAIRRPPPIRQSSAWSRAIKLLLALAIIGAIAGAVIWGIRVRIRTAAAVKQETLDLAVPSVLVAHPKLGAMKSEIVLPGNIQAFIDSPIYARASGYLKTWHTDIGARVKAGQVLAEIEAPELDQQVREAQSSLEQARAAREQANANLQQGRANEELARVTASRWNTLAGKGVVSRQENDQYQAQYQAQAASVEALQKALSAARSNVASVQANLGRLQEMQAFKTVRAPFDGVITARNTDIGALINAGAGTPSQELFHIAATKRLRVYVNVPQAYTRSAVTGLAAELTLAEFPGRRFRGTLVRTAEAMDTSSRTLLTEVDVDNASGELRPGAYAEVHLTLPAAVSSVIVPVGAILFRSEGLRVGLVRDANKVELVQVILGKDYGNEVEVLSGISQDDLVIMDPPDSLTSGAVVRVVSAPAPDAGRK